MILDEHPYSCFKGDDGRWRTYVKDKPLYRDIAERHMARFADATEAAEVSPDCEHLTEEGHRQLAGLLCGVIGGGSQ